MVIINCNFTLCKLNHTMKIFLTIKGKSKIRLSIILFAISFFSATGFFSQNNYAKIWTDAKKSFLDKNYKEANIGFTKIIQEMKIFSDSAFYLRACGYFELGDLHKAITDANRCVSLNKFHHQGYFLIGLIKSKSENYSGAIRSFNRAIKINPGNPKYYFDRGVAYLRNEDIDDALKDLEKAIQLKPDYAHAYFSRGYCKDLMGKTDEAIADIQKSIELDKKYSIAYTELALIHIRKKDTKKACEILNDGNKNGCVIPEDILKKYCK